MPEYAILNIPLKGFEQPDTKSQVEGSLTPGQYHVIAVKKNYPDEDTDFVSVDVPLLGDGETWICTRWKTKVYAQIRSINTAPAPDQDFSNDPLAIDEQNLVNLLPNFYSFTYDLDRARYPWELAGVSVPLAPPYTNNCCTFVEALLAKAWEKGAGQQWSIAKHGQMMIMSNDDFYSPITCLLESGMALPITHENQAPPVWSVMQGWRKQWNQGHTMIVLAHHLATDKVLTLESNASYRLNGVGYRMIGNLRDHQHPPTEWWKLDGLWTWERMKSVYRFRSLAQLKVKNLAWLPE